MHGKKMLKFEKNLRILIRAHSSVGQSGGLIIRWSEVQVLLGPPEVLGRNMKSFGAWAGKNKYGLLYIDLIEPKSVHSE